MPAVTRLNDKCSGHDACPGVPLEKASPNVRANGRYVGRVGDTYQTHGCLVHPGHNDKIAAGSGTVRVNGIPIGRIGDSVSIGGNVAEGSSNVRAGG